MQVDTDDQQASVAACINASASGLLLRTPVVARLGEWVRLTFRSTRSSSFIRIDAEVIRAETEVAMDDDGVAIWPNTIAVQFAHPVPKLELLLQCSDERRDRGRKSRALSNVG